MATNIPMLEVSELVVHCGSIFALDHVSLCVDQDEIISVIGASGTGWHDSGAGRAPDLHPVQCPRKPDVWGLHAQRSKRRRRNDERDLSPFSPLEERLHQRGRTLSGGELQMLAVRRALMSKPQILLLDEPSLGLAPIVIDGCSKRSAASIANWA